MRCRLARAGIALGCCALFAGCGGSAPVVGPAVSPDAAGPQAVTIGPSAASTAGSARAATLVVESGTTSIDVRAADLGGKLASASTPAGSGQRPTLTQTSDGIVHLQLAASGPHTGASGLDVQLSSAVTWTIRLEGGATDEQVDMRGGHLALVDLAAGASHVTIDVPARQGLQQIHEVGGVNELMVGVPPAVVSSVQVNGGAGSLVLGGTTHNGIGGTQTFTEPGYGTAAQRLLVLLQGGVSSVVVGPPSA
jgi:hypothetical protein